MIADFDTTGSDADRIDLDSFSFTSFAQVRAFVRDAPGGVTIDLPGPDDPSLLDVPAARLTADHFVL